MDDDMPAGRVSSDVRKYLAVFLTGMADAADDALVILDRDLRVVFFNTMAITLGLSVGLEPERMLGKRIRDVYPTLGDEMEKEYLEVFRSGRSVVRKRHVPVPSGSVWIESRKSPIRVEGEIAFVLLAMRNITHEQLTEDALTSAEKRYRRLVENIPVGVFRSTPEGTLLSANPTMVRMYGYTSEEEMKAVQAGTTYCDPAMRNLLMKRLFEDGAVIGFESKHRRRDGREIWVLSNMYATFDQHGRMEYFEGIDQDVTERKRIEDELRESERLTRAIIEHAPIGISVRDRHGRLLLYNDTWLKIWDIWPEDLLDYMNRPRTALTFDERDSYLGAWQDRVRDIYEHGGYLHIPELDAREARKPRPLWLSQHFYALHDDTGDVERVVILTEDITRHRQADDALRQSEEMTRLLLHNAPASIALFDYEGVCLFANERAAAEHGLAPLAMVGRHLREFFPQETVQVQMQTIRRVIDTQTGFSGQVKIALKNGEGWFDVNIHPLRNNDGTVRAAITITSNISEAKEAEAKLKESYDLLERRVAERTGQLAAANEELRIEHEMLQQKNITLQEVLGQIEDNKRAMAAQIQANINRIALPIVESLARKSDRGAEHHVKLLRECLTDIAAPFVSRLDNHPVSLSPRELQICNMIRGGLSSKQIAESLNISLLTVNKQRNHIRRKLGIANQKVNLVAYLRRLEGS